MGKRLIYQKAIKETTSRLKKIEKEQRESTLRDRVRFLRLLKSGEVKTQKEASEKIGISERQGQRNWEKYKKLGLSGLITPWNKGGGQRKLEEEKYEELKKDLIEKEIQFLHEAIEHVEEKYGKKYSLSGMHFVFKRIGIKKKTGRPVNIRQDKTKLEEFKKNSHR